MDKAKFAALLSLKMNDDIEIIDEDFDDGLVLYIDYGKHNLVLATITQLERPIMNDMKGNISRNKYEHAVDKYLDIEGEADMFFRLDIIHVFINEKNNRGIIRRYENATPYDVEEV